MFCGVKQLLLTVIVPHMGKEIVCAFCLYYEVGEKYITSVKPRSGQQTCYTYENI